MAKLAKTWVNCQLKHLFSIENLQKKFEIFK